MELVDLSMYDHVQVCVRMSFGASTSFSTNSPAHRSEASQPVMAPRVLVMQFAAILQLMDFPILVLGSVLFLGWRCCSGSFWIFFEEYGGFVWFETLKSDETLECDNLPAAGPQLAKRPERIRIPHS